MLRISRRERWLTLCGVAIGLAVMTKSAAGLLPLPIIATDYLLHRRWRTIPIRFLLLTPYALLLVAGPWHLAMTARHGMTFWNDYVGWHIVKRATEVLHNETAGTWWYIPTFARRFTPYTYWFAPALLSQFILSEAETKRRISQLQKDGALRTANRMGEILRRFTPQDKLGTLLLLWFLIGFALFTLMKTKFDWYLLPLYPAAVMLTVAFLATAREALTRRSVALLHLAAIAIAVTALPSLYPPGTWLDTFIERWYRLFGHPIVATIVVVLVAVLLTRWSTRQVGASRAGRIVTVAVTACILILAALVTSRHLMMPYPPNPFGAVIATLRGSNGVLVGYDLDYKTMPAGYFMLRSALRDHVRVLDGQHDVARTISMLRERERGFLLTKRETELPDELRQVLGDPRTFGNFMLWTRR